METLYDVRMYNPSTDKISVIKLTLSQIVENPYGLNSIDMAVVLINEARRQRGLGPIPKDAFVEYGATNG